MQLRRAIVGFIAVALALIVQASGVLAGFEDAAVDQRFRLRPAKPPADIVLVTVDERTFDVLGERPPLRRIRHAQMLDLLRRLHPRVIAYDVQFTEESESYDEDVALLEAVSRARPVVLVTGDVTVEGDVRIFGGMKNVRAAGAIASMSLLPYSRGSVYRRVTQRVNGYETLAFAAARVAGASPKTPDDPRGLLIDYAGPPGTVRRVSFVDVLHGRVPASVLRGKVIVVGVTALSEGDQRRTPTSRYDLMAGPEIQANALSTVMRGEPLRDAPGWVGLVLTALLAAWGAALAGRLSPKWIGVATIAMLALTAVGAYAVFRSGIVTDFAGPVAGLLLGVAVGVAARQLRARRRAHELRDVLTRLAGGRDVEELIARVNDHELVLLSPGARFGDYEIDGALGVGAMSVVHLARQTATGRLVALKVMSASLGDRPELRKRFVREAQAAAAADHDAVVPVLDAGEIAGRPYLAMRFVDGGTLADLIRGGTLSAAESIELLLPIADALDHAHRRGVIHRDVKPSNILVDGDGRSYLADFGIAHLLDASRMTTEFVGTPAYTAPEQVRNAELTGACDQYALGCVLFECLTGRVPFSSSNLAALMHAQLTEQPPAPSSLAPDVDPAIDAVLLRALAKEPADRHPSCSAMLAAAARALGAEPAERSTLAGDATEAGLRTALDTET